MRRIQLSNRYRTNNALVEFEENTFYLEFGDPQEWNWCRVGYAEDYDEEDPSYEFIDPSGGPFISIGMTFPEVPDKKVSRIYEEKVEGSKKCRYIIKFS